jgi:hypothetical protein
LQKSWLVFTGYLVNKVYFTMRYRVVAAYYAVFAFGEDIVMAVGKQTSEGKVAVLMGAKGDVEGSS